MDQTTSQLSETTLIAQVRSGAIPLYEIIVRRFNPDLYKVGRSYGYSHEDTEDLMQDTFVDAYRHLAQFRGESAFKTWLIRIMLNHCHRKKQRASYKNETSQLIHDNYVPMYPRDKNDPGQFTQRRELARILEEALAKIPEDYRMVYTLRELNGLSTVETADTLAISEANVRVRLNRAKAMLRATLEQSYRPSELYEFNLIYCDAIVAGVMQRINEL